MFSNVAFSVLAFILALGILVVIHEFGHFWVARKVGIKVQRFSVGFGKALFTRRGKLDDTEFVVAAIPCLLYTSPSPRDKRQSRMPSSA